MSRLVVFWAVAGLAACTPLDGGGARDLAGGEVDGGGADLAAPLGDLGPPVGDGPLATGADGGTPTWCPAGYTAATHTYCDPFDSSPLGGEWTPNGPTSAITFDSGRSAHGASSLQVSRPAATSATLTLDLGAAPPPPLPAWVRTYAYLPSTGRPPQVTLLAISGVSFTATTGGITLGGGLDPNASLPLDRWTCVEILLERVDAGSTRFSLFVDGAPRLSTVEGVAPALSGFSYGGQGPMSNYTVWLDELVISGTRPGCPP